MAPPSPKPPAASPPKQATPRGDDGPRWLSRPERAAPTNPNAPPAGSAPASPTAARGFESTNTAPEPLPAQLGGRWGTYALIAGIALLASSAVVAALLFAARAPGNADSATRALNALATPSTRASAAPTETAKPPPSATSTATASEIATPTPTAVPTPTPTPTATPTATATATATATPTPTPTATPTATDEGTISTAPTAAGHRVFVDGRYAGDSPGPIKVHCGARVVKVGSGGTPHTVEVPCGGDVLVPAR